MAVLAIALQVAHGQFGLGGHSLDDFIDNWLYDAVIIGGALSCVARGFLVREERLMWLIFGAGLLFDASGEVYYSLVYGTTGTPPIPSFDDVLYLLYYPCAYVALVLLVRKRMERFSASQWLDGAIAATTSAAVVAAIAAEAIVRSASHGSVAAVATTFAYPVGDLILLGIVVAVFALSGWRPGRAWLLLGCGLGLSAIADTSYVYASAQGSYSPGDILDTFWLLAAFALGSSAWQPAPRSVTLALDDRRLLVIPGVFSLVALSVLVYGGFHHVSVVGLVLASAAVLIVFARASWTFYENVSLLERSRHESLTDSLTGLGNRRRMTNDLARELAEGPAAPDRVLVMFDLDGFKLYNDRFGHLAGDTLLEHFGRRLQTSVSHAGAAYRLGGDEFCVLLRDGLDNADVHIAAAAAALTAEGEGFMVGASHGRVAIPAEATNPTQALRIADDRMYAHKGGRRGSARDQTHSVLLGLLHERQPELHHHLRHVGQLAVLVGRRLQMDDVQLNDLRQAAELHDIGKAAIPDAILDKPGPLSQDEWTFMRRHTIVGERILAAAPALAPVATLVRASHERWDGKGYPDGVAGTAIPLGARIVSVCDAFDAMIGDRSYTKPKSSEEAIAELRNCSGTQFDPTVVEAFVVAWEEASAAPAQLLDPLEAAFLAG